MADNSVIKCEEATKKTQVQIVLDADVSLPPNLDQLLEGLASILQITKSDIHIHKVVDVFK